MNAFTYKQLAKDFSLDIPCTNPTHLKAWLPILATVSNSEELIKLEQDANLECVETTGHHLGACLSKLREGIVEFIQKSEVYIELNNQKDVILPMVSEKLASTGGNLYQKQLLGKKFVSLDMQKANFQVMSKVYPTLFGWESDLTTRWDLFITLMIHRIFDERNMLKFEKYAQKSKMIRQVIFGNLNPKRQQHWQRQVMQSLRDFIEQEFSDLIQSNKLDMQKSIVQSTSDEIVIDLSAMVEAEQDNFIYRLDIKLDQFNGKYGFKLTSEVFTLAGFMYDHQQGYLKCYEDRTIPEVCTVPAQFMPQVTYAMLQHLVGRSISIPEELLLFTHEGRDCKWLEPLKFEF